MATKKAEPSLLDQYKANQVAEWSVFVCGPTPIDIGGARAFNPGDAVPASHVTRGVVREDQVIARDDEKGMSSLQEIPSKPDPVADLPGMGQPVIVPLTEADVNPGGDK